MVQLKAIVRRVSVMTDSYTRGQAIKAATEEALAQLDQLDQSALLELQVTYQQALKSFTSRLTQLSVDGFLYLDHLRQLDNFISELVEDLSLHHTTQLQTNINDSVLAAASINPLLATGAARAIWELELADGLKLSDRLWKLDQYTKSMLSRSLRTAIAIGDNANQAARAFLEQQLSIPEHIKNEQNQSSIKHLSSLTGRDLLTGNGSALHNAQRLFRTEIGRAHHMAMLDVTDDPDLDIIGFKFCLSPAHPRRDICDMHATVNLYNLGRGVYPRKVISRVYPAHPNTKSYTKPIFREDHDQSTKDNNRIDWLLLQSEQLQVDILGKKKAELLRDGLLNEQDIDKPLHQIV